MLLTRQDLKTLKQKQKKPMTFIDFKTEASSLSSSTWGNSEYKFSDTWGWGSVGWNDCHSAKKTWLLPYCKLFPDILMSSKATITSSGCKPNSGKRVYHLHNRCSVISAKSPQNLALSNNSFYLYGLLKYLGLTIISTNIHHPAMPLALSSLSTYGRQIAKRVVLLRVCTFPLSLPFHKRSIFIGQTSMLCIGNLQHS
jgi:hypothetical protein